MKIKKKIEATRRTKIFYSEKTRVITRLHIPSPEKRIKSIINRVLSLEEENARELLNNIFTDFSDRHRHFRETLIEHYEHIKEYLDNELELSMNKKLLLGAYFTMEYSVEAAAIFNPSMILLKNSKNQKNEKTKFIMSFRVTGEGHISSIEFRSGSLDKHNNILFDPISSYVAKPQIHTDRTYDKHLFILKLYEMRASNEVTHLILKNLPDNFVYDELDKKIEELLNETCFIKDSDNDSIDMVRWLAKSNYEIKFDSKQSISERVIFPVSENESRGIEDARFVEFVDDDKTITYYATYTAFNGFKILPQLIETKDFISFHIITLNGKAVQNKGMALFPRKINGNYVMLSRQDGENNHIMFSNHLHFWQESTIIHEPKLPWEFVQVGNCGSPIETEKGWLILTHGVGPMRQYCMGIKLLDLNDPRKVIGHIDYPVITPNSTERDGYVPNVVYSCGGVIHNNELIIPYAMADSRTGIATLKIKDIFNNMRYEAT